MTWTSTEKTRTSFSRTGAVAALAVLRDAALHLETVSSERHGTPHAVPLRLLWKAAQTGNGADVVDSRRMVELVLVTEGLS